MTNTRITDSEVFERRYPVLLREFSLREGSGGLGQHKGGDGVVRDIEFRIPVQVSILSERRVYHPYGLAGGEDAQCGQNIWVRGVGELEGSDADVDGSSSPSSSASKQEVRYINLGGKNTASMQAGDRIIINTPGGGGWGPVGKESQSKQWLERQDPKLAWKGGSVAGRQAEAEASA